MAEAGSSAVRELKQATSQPAPVRSLLVDVVRGMAIALVVFGHTDQGVARRGWWGGPLGDRIWLFIYEFHMPAFFFVSGVFIASSVAKRGPVKFINTKIAQMMYPYFLWSILEYVLAFPLQRFIHVANPSFREFLLDLARGDTLWFLPAIFFCVLLGMLLRNVNKPLLFAGSVVLALLPVTWHINFVYRTIQHLPFLVAGMWVARRYERIERIPIALAASAAVVLGAVVLAVSLGSHQLNHWLEVPVGLAGTAMLFLLARCCRKGSFARTMAWAGEASFGIYLMSAYPQGFTREGILRVLHTTEPYLQVLLPSLVAIFIPAWIYQHRVRLRVGWLFVWPF